MSHNDRDPTKKHRHDIGAVEHGARSTARTTRSIQVILGLCVVSTVALMIFSAWHMFAGR